MLVGSSDLPLSVQSFLTILGEQFIGSSVDCTSSRCLFFTLLPLFIFCNCPQEPLPQFPHELLSTVFLVISHLDHVVSPASYTNFSVKNVPSTCLACAVLMDRFSQGTGVDWTPKRPCQETIQETGKAQIISLLIKLLSIRAKGNIFCCFKFLQVN